MSTISAAQKYIWLDQAIHEHSARYNIGGYVCISGKLDVDKFRTALSVFINSQEILSFSFRESDGIPVSVKNDHADELHFMDLSGRDEAFIHDWIVRDFQVPFSLDEFPLYRFVLIKQAEDKYTWYAKVHHIVSDGSSFRLLFNQVSRLYELLKKGEQLPLQYHQFSLAVEDDEQYRSSPSFAADREYWVEKFKSPPSYIYSANASGKSGAIVHELLIDQQARLQLQEFAQRNNVSLFVVFTAFIALYAARSYRNYDLAIGFPVMNRGTKFREVMGMFINILSMRLQVDGDCSFSEFLKMIKKESMSCLRHQRFQQADLLKHCAVKPGFNRFYDIRISYEEFRFNIDESILGSLIKPLSNETEEDPVSVHIMDYVGGNISVRFDFNAAYVKDFEALSFVRSFEWLTTHITESTDCRLSDIKLISPEDEAAVHIFSRGPVAARPHNICFLHSWNEVVYAVPEKIAISFKGKNFSYAEIDARATALASVLYKQGIERNDRVAIFLDRSEQVIIAMLAIMKAGATIVALDKEYPVKRLQFILRDSQCRFCIADENAAMLSGIHVIDINHADELLASSTNGHSHGLSEAAYIIYTSGSTGQPKGVAVSHASLYDYVSTFTNYFELTPNDIVLQQSSFSFDTSIEEIFPVLAAGGKLVIAEVRNDIPLILQELQREKVTLFSTNPYVIQFLNDSKAATDINLRVLISGGDVLKPEYISNLVGRIDIYNTYGPTESTVCATYYQIQQVPATSIPIGRPITNRSVYILDDFNHLQPIGAPGEICIGGAGLALQYINLPAETAKAFSFVPVANERVYRTGDLGVRLPDGNIVFAGRKDRQLSVNGYRIEPGEIEHCISAINGVKDCVVDTIERHGHKLLAAYVVTDELKPAAIREAVAAQLPAAMVPSVIMAMEALPLMSNGKIDRSQLPAADVATDDTSYELPATVLEEKIAAIWKQLLKREDIGRNNNFFELGGHSLLANQFVSIAREEFKTELSLKTFYRNPDIRSLAAIIDSSLENKEELITILPAPEDAMIPLSYAQERLWFLNQLDKNNSAYNVPRALKMSGDLQLEILEETFTQLVERHEILRTVFRTTDGVPYQVVLPPYRFHIPVIDHSGKDAAEQQSLIEEFIFNEGNQYFNLAEGPLLKVTLLKLSETENILVVCEHHLIHDGWTQGVLLNEFIQLYSALVTDQPSPLPPLTIQYGDFAYWQKQYFNEERLKDSLSYWTRKLKDVDPGLNLPMYKPRPVINAGKGDMQTVHIPKEVYDNLTGFCKKYNVTAFMTMLGVFKLLLHKYSNDVDICVGTGVANRRIREISNMLGMVINTIALRTELNMEESFLQLVNKVKTTCLEGYENEDAPFGEVVNAVNPVRTLATHPLVQYMFSFMNTPTRRIELPDLNIEVVESYNHSAKFDICITVIMPIEDRFTGAPPDEDPEIIIEWEYNTDIFDKHTMKRMLAAYVRTLSQVLHDPNKKIESINVLSRDERDELLAFSWQSYPETGISADRRARTLIDLFEEQVARTPDNIALVSGETWLSYSELNEVSGQLANYLRSNYSIQPDQLTGILLDKNEWLIISILGVLKSGGAYVPIDPDYPADRIEYMIADSNCKMVIDEEEIKKFRKEKNKYDWRTSRAAINGEDLAYVIYTSGSTGKPKGVMIEHSAVVNLVLSQIKTFGIQEDENILQLSNISFDASVEQIFIALASGARLSLIDKETVLDAYEMDKFISRNMITHIHAVPGVLKTFQPKKYPHLKRVISGGDRCPRSLAESWSAHHAFYNEYGPTETTVTSIELLYNERNEKTEILSIGRPIENTTVYIVNDNDDLSPIGVPGEMYIGGAGVARGYLNRPELTRDKFIPDPFRKGARVYKTGDQARWLPDGTIEFIGRADDQVKVRGYRIELGEIENAFQSLAAIDKVAVVARPNAERENELVAYLVMKESLNIADLRSMLSALLPAYMIPAHFMILESMPLTQSGKIDRKKLPDHAAAGMKAAAPYVAPRNETEEKLVLIWQEVLGKERIGVKDNFFELGGHSLKATRVIAKIHDRFGIKIDVRDIFTDPTIENLSNCLDTISWVDKTMEVVSPEGSEIIL